MTSADVTPGAEVEPVIRVAEVRAIIEQGDAERSSCNNGPDAERMALNTIERIRQLLGPAPAGLGGEKAGRFAVTNPPLTVGRTTEPVAIVEIDQATGWPIFTVGGTQYAVGHRVAATRFSHVDYVPYFWLDVLHRDRPHRAYADALRGSTNRQIWDARYAYDASRNT